ncbi:MAG: glycosyltransferase family 2 protein [Bacteroidota bacterium]
MADINKISAVIITKNEEANIERCLKSLHWVDEIIVADSGSSDRTVEICAEHNCKIIETEWLGYGKTKRLAVNSAENNWILSIDADEEVSKNSVQIINDIVKTQKYTGYKVQIKSFYLGKMIKHSGWGQEFKLRIFDKRFGNYNESEIHETVILDGKKKQIDAVFLHHTYPTLEKHLEKVNRYSSLQAKELFDDGKKYSILLIPIFALNKFLSMYILKLGFLDGKEGFVLASISSFGVFLKYTKLWKLNKK